MYCLSLKDLLFNDSLYRDYSEYLKKAYNVDLV
jgi:hypothetical protein